MALFRPNTYGAGQGITYDPETLKVVWENLAAAAGVRILYHTLVIDALLDHEPDRRRDRRQQEPGCCAIRARVVIDASGDADVAAAAGAPFEGAKDRSGPVPHHHLPPDQCRRGPRPPGEQRTELHALMEEATAERRLSTCRARRAACTSPRCPA